MRSIMPPALSWTYRSERGWNVEALEPKPETKTEDDYLCKRCKTKTALMPDPDLLPLAIRNPTLIMTQTADRSIHLI
jgi:hypothetical protein